MDPVPTTPAEQNQASRDAWNANAAFWDERMGEGNDFQLKLLAPALEQLLDIRPGMRVLDAACGNGQFSRRLVELGASVVAFDGAAAMIERARERSHTDSIGYHVIDATDREGAILGAGYALDGLLEPVFEPPPDKSGRLDWTSVPGIPPVLVARMRSPA